MFMENLTVFYRILNEDLSPLLDSSNKDYYVNFLRKRYPDYIHQLKVRLHQRKNGYDLKGFKESYFCDLEPSSKKLSESEIKQTNVLDFVYEKFKIDAQQVVEQGIFMEDSLIRLDLILREDYDNLPDNKAKFYYYKIMLAEARSEICRKMHEKVLRLISEDQTRLYVKKYQSLASCYMKSILIDYIPREEWNSLFQISGNYTTTDIFKITYQTLEDILVYVEKSFNQYLDINLPVPYQSRLLLAIEHAEKLSKVLTHLEWARLDYQLYEIVTMPFDQLGTLEPLTFSYLNHHYHEAYLLALYQETLEQEPFSNKKVWLILWRMNFNALKFFNYLTRQIHIELKEKETIGEKLELLYYYQKLCNQLPVKTHLRYNPNLPPLKDQIVIWLQEEIGFQKRKLKHGDNNHSRTQTISEKTLLKMSVPQLSLFVRAIFEIGLVDGTRQDLLRFVAEHYRTDQQDSISLGSLKGKYYKVDTGTKRTVGRMLKKMLAHIEGAGKNY